MFTFHLLGKPFTLSCSGRAEGVDQLFLDCFRVEESQDWDKKSNQEKEAQSKYFCLQQTSAARTVFLPGSEQVWEYVPFMPGTQSRSAVAAG